LYDEQELLIQPQTPRLLQLPPNCHELTSEELYVVK